MAKRKSINKHLSKYSRSSIGSGFLDPNSEVLGEEEPFWWNNLTNNASQSLLKNNVTSQTSKYLDSDSQTELSNTTSEWWNVSNSTDSEKPDNLPSIKKNKPVTRITKATISDSDEEGSSPLPQKKKIVIRSKSIRSKSNPFLKAFIDSENSKSSKLIQDTTLAKPLDDASIGNISLKIIDVIEDNKSENDNINITTSTDQSHTTDKILKPRPQVFRKRYKQKSENVFEDLLKSAENKHNETDATQVAPVNSSDKLVQRNEISIENVSNILEKNDTGILQEHISEKHSSLKDVSKQSTTNLGIFNHSGNHIYYKHSDSSFEIQSDHINEDSQKESLVTNNVRNRMTTSTYASEDNDRTQQVELNISTSMPKQKSSKKKSILSKTDNINEENFSQDNDKTRSEKINISTSRAKQKSDRHTSIPNKSLLRSQTDNLNKENFSKDNHTTHSEEINFEPSTSKQRFSRSTRNLSKDLIMSQTDNSNKDNFAEDVDTTQSEEINFGASKSKQRFSRSIRNLSRDIIMSQTDNLNKDNFSGDVHITQPEEINFGASKSKQRFSRSTRNLSKDLIMSQTDNLNKDNFSGDIDITQPEEINFGASTSKQRFSRSTRNLSKDLIMSQADNLNKDNFSGDIDITQPEEINFGASTSKQRFSRSSRNLSKDLIMSQTDNLNDDNFSGDVDTTQPEKINLSTMRPKQKSDKNITIPNKSLITPQTGNLDKQNFSKDNDIARVIEININTSMSKEKSIRKTDILSGSPVKPQSDNLNNGNFLKNNDKKNKSKEINIDPSTLKQKSKGKELIRKLEKIKRDTVIKKRLEQKMEKINFNKFPTFTLSSEELIREKIKELQNKKTKKPPIKPEIHRAYLVNGKPYKRPRLPRPQSWVTDRLYRHLWKMMEPKCKSLTRVESEKFVKRLSQSVSSIIKSKKYDDYKDELNDLMNNMARLGIILTRNDFYDFSHEFFPYDFRIKVIPMIMPGNVRNIPYDPEKLDEPLIVK